MVLKGGIILGAYVMMKVAFILMGETSRLNVPVTIQRASFAVVTMVLQARFF